MRMGGGWKCLSMNEEFMIYRATLIFVKIAASVRLTVG
jgi:hypothetical protein